MFYYLRHDGSGFSTFGTISTSGAITDRFGVGSSFDALTFAEGPAAVPEPSTLLLLGSGLAGLGLWKRFKVKS